MKLKNVSQVVINNYYYHPIIIIIYKACYLYVQSGNEGTDVEVWTLKSMCDLLACIGEDSSVQEARSCLSGVYTHVHVRSLSLCVITSVYVVQVTAIQSYPSWDQHLVSQPWIHCYKYGTDQQSEYQHTRSHAHLQSTAT